MPRLAGGFGRNRSAIRQRGAFRPRCRDLAAVINGSRLYVLNRYTGDILFETTVNDVPGGSPALSTKRAYVPTASGKIYAYRLEPITDPAKELGKINPNLASMSDEEKKEAAKQGRGRSPREYPPAPGILPAADLCVRRPGDGAADYRQAKPRRRLLASVTDNGHLHLGRVNRRSPDDLLIKWRFTVKGTFANPPVYMPPQAWRNETRSYRLQRWRGLRPFRAQRRDTVEFLHRRSDHRFARADRRPALRGVGIGRPVRHRRQDGQTDLVGAGIMHFVAAGGSESMPPTSLGGRNSRWPHGQCVGHLGYRGSADQSLQRPDRPDLPGHGKRVGGMSPRSGRDTSRSYIPRASSRSRRTCRRSRHCPRCGPNPMTPHPSRLPNCRRKSPRRKQRPLRLPARGCRPTGGRPASEARQAGTRQGGEGRGRGGCCYCAPGSRSILRKWNVGVPHLGGWNPKPAKAGTPALPTLPNFRLARSFGRTPHITLLADAPRGEKGL